MKVPVSLKVAPDIHDKIESLRGDTSKSAYIEEILKNYFRSAGETVSNTGEVAFLRDQVQGLTRLLENEQRLRVHALPEKKGFWGRVRFW